MKTLTKIFMAVVAGMFAFSCVQDTTEDLGVKIENQAGVSELVLSLEQSRTHLGEKTEGLYPLYWSNGDAISVNGVVSHPLEGISTTATAAEFKLNQEVTRPLCVVYPASAATTIEDEVVEEEVTPAPVVAYPVHFLAQQPYTVGSFAPQAAPMYGYAAELAEGEEETPVQLNHLTGVLRLAIKGSGEKVTSIAVKAEKGKIAGPFTVDCTNGTLTAQDGATATVTVTCGEGLVLGAEATPVYVTVPAGNYGTFVITVTTEAHGKMTVKFNSDVKPINAGVVREFSEFAFEANANDNDEIFLIDSEEALIEFANIAGTFYPRTAAKVVANLDMSGYDWKPIATFGAYEFDGGSDEGYTINGLSAPLFETTAANIKNVKLTNIDYSITDLAFSGAIACNLYGSLDNCSAEGKININNTTYAPETVGNNYGDIAHGGLVGMAHGATVTNSTNDIDITITSFCEATKDIKAEVGGIVGGANVGCSFSYLTNNGDITYAGTTQKGNIYISGILGRNSDANGQGDIVMFTNCKNNGNITTTTDSVNAGDILMAGGTGRLSMTADTVCDQFINTGNITHNGKCAGARMAGVVAYYSVCSFTNCSNSGNFTINTGAKATSSYMAGIAAGETTTDKIHNCTNSGNLYVGEKIAFAGFVGLFGTFCNVSNDANKTTPAEVTNCTNSGSFYCGECSNTVTKNGGRLYIGGVFGTIQEANVSHCVNEATGTMTAKTGDWVSIYMIGGVSAYVGINTGTYDSSSLTHCENKAAIYAEAIGTVGGAQIGGVTGEVYVNKASDAYKAYYTNVKNSGDITVKGTWSGAYPYVGGFLAINNHDNVVLKNCENAGDITFDPTSAVKPCIGGLVGLDDNNFTFVIDDCVNSGNIIQNGAVTEIVRTGGIIGYRGIGVPTEIKNTKNTGTITLADQTVNTDSYAYRLGGIVGSNYKAKLTITNCTNGALNSTDKGNITVGAAPTGVALAGIIGYSDAVLLELSGCKNYGTIKQTGTGGKGNTYRAHISGIISVCLADNLAVLNCENYGNIEYGTAKPGGRVDVAGIMATTTKITEFNNCKNGGKIEFKGVGAGSEISVAGICGVPGNTIFTNCVNLASAEIIGSGTTSSGYDIGGIGGGPNSPLTQFNNCKNYGTVKHTTKGSNSTYVGGIVGYGYAFKQFVDCENHGPVTTVGSTGTAYIGGIVGWARIAADSNTSASTRIMRNCVNYYNIDLSSHSAAGALHAGGIAGRLNDEDADRHWEEVSGCKNYGNITYSSAAKTAYYGGLFGSVGVSATDSKYTAGGKRDNSTPHALAEISNCVSYGNLKCLGGKKVSLFTGVARSASCKFINCSVGGNLILSTETGEDANGDVETVDVLTPVTADNMKDYLYSAAITADDVAADVITLLTEKPAEATHTH